MPPNGLVVTIDDGYKGNYGLLDVFKDYDVRPTIYLCSHIVNTSRHFWMKTGISNLEKLKKIPFNELVQVLRNEIGFEFDKEYEDTQSLTKAELEKMQSFVDYGSHTKFHPILTTCTSVQCKDEIETSKAHLEKVLNRPIEHFCYPNGDFGAREIEYLKKAGYRSGRTLDWGWNDKHSDPFKLKVIEFLDDSSINDLCATISGVFALIRVLRFGIRKIVHL